MQIQVDSKAVASDDTLKAKLLEILYAQPEYTAGWALIDEALDSWSSGAWATEVSNAVFRAVAEGKIEDQGKGMASCRFRLTVSQWLSITKSRQLCSTISTGSQT